MSKGLPRAMAHANPQVAQIVKQHVDINAVMAIVSQTGTDSFTTAVIGGLPEGNILFLGAVLYIRLTSASAGVIATFNGHVAVGTASNADATLAGTEVNIIPSSVLGAATAKVGPVLRTTHSKADTGDVFDNTDGSLELNLNILIDDASISADSSFNATGTLDLSYIMLGDD